MARSPHCFLSGAGVDAFAAQHGLALQEADYFITPHRIAQLDETRAADAIVLDHGSINAGNTSKMGTVGAVARDTHGNLAGSVIWYC